MAREFDTKQKAFRDNLAASSQQKPTESQSQASSSASSSASHASDFASVDVANPDAHGLGSLSSDAGEAATHGSDQASKAKGALVQLIYGTKEGREMDRDIERSYSEKLARGKYVHSIVFHEVKPDKVDEYVKLVGGWYPKVAANAENKVHLVGSWRTEVGDCDTFGRTLPMPRPVWKETC